MVELKRVFHVKITVNVGTSEEEALQMTDMKRFAEEWLRDELLKHFGFDEVEVEVIDSYK